MTRPVRRAALLLGLGSLAMAIPVLAQDSPESILPPGFDAPPPQKPKSPSPPKTPSPAASPTPAAASRPQTPATGTLPSGQSIPPAQAGQNGAANQPAPDSQSADSPGAGVRGADEKVAEKYDLPASARRSLDVIGPLPQRLGGLAPDAFGTTHGPALSRLMTATHPPFISRWAGILLRRALLTHSQTPTDIDGADWVAARAWLLLRMGESDNARRLIQDVDSDQYTKSLYGVAMQIYLATADPAGFCGLLPRALDFSKEPSWFMAQAICASFSADQKTASNLLRQAARRGIAHGIDYRLAEKVVGAGPDSRRSVDIEWTGVNRLTAWRFGLATATNVTIPPALYGTAGLRVRAWEAQAPTLDLATRRRGAEIATRLGVFSGAAALGYYDQLAALPDADNDARDIGDLLNAAYHGPTILGRVSAMHKFWSRNPINGNAASGPDGVYYGALPVIARAAAAIPPTSAIAGNAPWLIAAMLSGGYDRNAAHWQPVVDKLTSANRQRAWALLVTGLPNPTLDLSNRRIEAFIGQDESEDRHFGHMLIAALAGLDRVSADQRDQLLKGSDINPNPTSRWGRAILAAANRHEQGTVALLAAVGMQATDWHKFPPQNLYLVVAALHRVGLDPYARMIAAEAMARVG